MVSKTNLWFLLSQSLQTSEAASNQTAVNSLKTQCTQQLKKIKSSRRLGIGSLMK
jgi:hypothetical protein